MADHQLAVVGAGPAGLAAAVAAAEQGLRVALVDAAGQPGGQFWRHPDESTASTGQAHGQHLWRRFTDLQARLRALGVPGRRGGRVDLVAGRQVWLVEPGAPYTLHLTPSHASVPSGTAVRRVRARALVLCPGGYDRQLPVPGWDLPGVMAAGGVQALLKGHRSLAGHRAVVAGTGPFLLPVATGLAEAGARVVAVCEANALIGWARSPAGACSVPSKAVEAVGYAAALARHRIRYRQRTAVTAVHGDRAVTAVSLARLDRDGRIRADTPADQVEVDLVAFGWGFTPSLELLTAVGARPRLDIDESLVVAVDDWQRTDVPGVYAAGEVTGVGGAQLALAEGELAGLTAALDGGRPVPGPRIRGLQRAVRRSRRFAAAMHRAHPVPAAWDQWLRPDTVVCRCEEVSVFDVRAARDELGATDARTVKLLARPGMGWCQGRVCGFATAKLVAGSGRALCADDLAPNSRRTLAAAVTLRDLADT
jgi:NADP-dependent aldehyde dehydrogenase